VDDNIDPELVTMETQHLRTEYQALQNRYNELLRSSQGAGSVGSASTNRASTSGGVHEQVKPRRVRKFREDASPIGENDILAGLLDPVRSNTKRRRVASKRQNDGLSPSLADGDGDGETSGSSSRKKRSIKLEVRYAGLRGIIAFVPADIP
jgi:hypothetical protein